MTMSDQITIDTQPSPVHPADLPTLAFQLNQSGTIRSFSPVPQEVQAVQFQGWSNAHRIFSWIDGVMFVPKGYDHQLRLPEEFDPQTKDLHQDAPEFLAVKAGNGVFRVDLGYWLVRLSNGEMHVYNNDMFASVFQETHSMY